MQYLPAKYVCVSSEFVHVRLRVENRERRSDFQCWLQAVPSSRYEARCKLCKKTIQLGSLVGMHPEYEYVIGKAQIMRYKHIFSNMRVIVRGKKINLYHCGWQVGKKIKMSILFAASDFDFTKLPFHFLQMIEKRSLYYAVVPLSQRTIGSELS